MDTVKGDKVMSATTEDLLVVLTDDEYVDRAEKLGQAQADMEAFESHKKEVQADLKARAERLEGERSKLGRIVRNRAELRPVRVQTEADYTRGEAVDVRVDTGEVIRSRALLPHERQEALFTEPPVSTIDSPPRFEDDDPLEPERPAKARRRKARR